MHHILWKPVSHKKIGLKMRTYIAAILTLIMFMNFGRSVLAQDAKEIKIYNHVRVNTADGYAEIQCLPTKKPDVSISSNEMYFWTNGKVFQSTQGGFTGYLLHGPFERYSTEGILIEKGSFDHGIKDGRWTKWQTSGYLLEDCTYSKGDLDGMAVYYDKGGKVIKTAEFRDGSLHGDLIVYKSDTVFSHKVFRRGELIRENGKHLVEKESIPTE